MAQDVIAVVIHGLHEKEQMLAKHLATRVREKCSEDYGSDCVIHWLPVHWEWLCELKQHAKIRPLARKSKMDFRALQRFLQDILQETAHAGGDSVSESCRWLSPLLEDKLAAFINAHPRTLSLKTSVILNAYANDAFFSTELNWPPKFYPLESPILTEGYAVYGCKTQSANDSTLRSYLHRE